MLLDGGYEIGQGDRALGSWANAGMLKIGGMWFQESHPPGMRVSRKHTRTSYEGRAAHRKLER